MSDLSYPYSPSPPNSESDGESAHSGYDPTYSSDELIYPKRQRLRGRIRKAAVDPITALPESLLLHVLSFLPIEDAVKTQVLSKRWLHLWTYSTSLVFLHDSDKSVSDFVTFVDRTLVLCNCSKLKKLGVRFAYEPDYASNVNLWTMFAMGKGAEELQLDFENVPWEIDEEVGYYLLPQLLYSKSSFKVLQFSKCNVMPKGVVCWNSLKKLSIGYAGLSEDVIQKILAGLLQSLVHVKKITLGTLAIQVSGNRPPWDSKHVGKFPNLETLVITTSSSNYDACFSDACTELCNFDEKSYWTSKEKPLMCLTLRLHEVKFIGLGSYNFDFHLSFAQFLLKNARVLQKMVIDSKTESCNWPKEFVRAARKLLSFPRSSPNAVVLF
ncbi:hypothetical protein C3L33_06320, partial [Rhododendron williamsianum]